MRFEIGMTINTNTNTNTAIFCLLPHVNILQLLCTGYIYKNVLITMYRYPDMHSSSIISREKGKNGRHGVHDSDGLVELELQGLQGGFKWECVPGYPTYPMLPRQFVYYASSL